jgi:hypothetical protein
MQCVPEHRIGSFIDMPVTDSQFGKLQQRVKAIEDSSIVKPLLHPAPQPQKLSTLSTVLAVIGIATFVGGAVWIVHSEVSRIDQTMDNIDKRIGSLTIAVKILAEAQGGKTKELVEDALAVAQMRRDAGQAERTRIEGEIQGYFAQQYIKESKTFAAEGKPELAVAAAQEAVSTLASATEKKLPASPGYFTDTVEIINGVAKTVPSPQLSQKLQDARLSLADYRSALLVGQVNYTAKYAFGPTEHGGKLARGSTIIGGYLDASTVTGDLFVGSPGLTGTLADNIRIQGTIISGGFQTLDGMHWSKVVFIGTHIRYRGGQLDLDHVTFVGCTFEAPDNDRGAKFAEYAALLLPQLTIG